ncbi:hypothetical protein [Streptomyces spongiae]|uniref:Uncharacterized protein n=1 Tax=Streptomyces spongiae TaxID=565072 RepID=A0A5N8XIN5_9ACTN|nr:hypothetical protein [Streptomyces spongiae]MPY59330.1 hypothetical protein [Streptomyces spongiae]
MTSLDRASAGTESSERLYAWPTVVTTLATLATVLALAFTGNDEAAAAIGTAGILGGAVQITVHIRR